MYELCVFITHTPNNQKIWLHKTYSEIIEEVHNHFASAKSFKILFILICASVCFNKYLRLQTMPRNSIHILYKQKDTICNITNLAREGGLDI